MSTLRSRDNAHVAGYKPTEGAVNIRGYPRLFGAGSGDVGTEDAAGT